MVLINLGHGPLTKEWRELMPASSATSLWSLPVSAKARQWGRHAKSLGNLQRPTLKATWNLRVSASGPGDDLGCEPPPPCLYFQELFSVHPTKWCFLFLYMMVPSSWLHTSVCSFLTLQLQSPEVACTKKRGSSGGCKGRPPPFSFS